MRRDRVLVEGQTTFGALDVTGSRTRDLAMHRVELVRKTVVHETEVELGPLERMDCQRIRILDGHGGRSVDLEVAEYVGSKVAPVVEGHGAANLAVEVDPDALPIEVLDEGCRNQEPVLAAWTVELFQVSVGQVVDQVLGRVSRHTGGVRREWIPKDLLLQGLGRKVRVVLRKLQNLLPVRDRFESSCRWLLNWDIWTRLRELKWLQGNDKSSLELIIIVSLNFNCMEMSVTILCWMRWGRTI